MYNLVSNPKYHPSFSGPNVREEAGKKFNKNTEKHFQIHLAFIHISYLLTSEPSVHTFYYFSEMVLFSSS